MLLTEDQIKLFRNAVEQKKIKVGVFDVETSYILARVWGTGPNQYIAHDQVVNETQLITAQFMYSLDKESDYKAWKVIRKPDKKNNIPGIFDDSDVVSWITNKVNKCDLVIAQNGKAFDIKVVQERAKKLRLPPLNVDFMIDTYKTSSSSFKTLSHGLDARSEQYGLGGKIKMVRQDWIDIIELGIKPEVKMVPYGLKDNLDTDAIFWLDLPYINFPKATITKILQLITKNEYEQLLKNKEYKCDRCALARQSRYNIQIVEKKPTCCNCGNQALIKL